MAKKSHSPEQIINKLREAEILLNQGATVGEASRKIGVTEQTCYELVLLVPEIARTQRMNLTSLLNCDRISFNGRGNLFLELESLLDDEDLDTRLPCALTLGSPHNARY